MAPAPAGRIPREEGAAVTSEAPQKQGECGERAVRACRRQPWAPEGARWWRGQWLQSRDAAAGERCLVRLLQPRGERTGPPAREAFAEGPARRKQTQGQSQPSAPRNSVLGPRSVPPRGARGGLPDARQCCLRETPHPRLSPGADYTAASPTRPGDGPAPRLPGRGAATVSAGRWEWPHQQQTRDPRFAVLQDQCGPEVGPAPGQGAAQLTRRAVHGPEAEAGQPAVGERPLPLACLRTRGLTHCASSPPALPRSRETSHLALRPL